MGPHNRRVTDSPGCRCVRPCARLTCPRASCARDARTRRLSVCQFAARALGPPRARAAPPPSKTRHPAANRLLSAACPHIMRPRACARMPARPRPRPRPRDARTKNLAPASFQLGPWATAGLGPRHLLPRPAALRLTGCFPPRARAHHAPA